MNYIDTFDCCCQPGSCAEDIRKRRDLSYNECCKCMFHDYACETIDGCFKNLEEKQYELY